MINDIFLVYQITHHMIAFQQMSCKMKKYLPTDCLITMNISHKPHHWFHQFPWLSDIFRYSDSDQLLALARQTYSERFSKVEIFARHLHYIIKYLLVGAVFL